MADANLTIDISNDHHGLGGTITANKCELTYRRITLKKKIYKPGELTLELAYAAYSSSSGSDYIEKIRSYFITKSGFTIDVKGKDGKIIAKHYYVFNVRFSYDYRDDISGGKVKEKKRMMLVIVTAYSPDYFLTLNKYCQAYRGKKISEIIRDKVDSLKYTYKYEVKEGTGKDEKTVVKEATVTPLTFPANEELCLCNTIFIKEEGSNNYPVELIQPYLVQYNESTYDFLVRVANRCGELFFYESGTLYLGVASSTLKSGSFGTTAKIKDDRNGIEYSTKSLNTGFGIEPSHTIGNIAGELSFDFVNPFTATKNYAKNLITGNGAPENSTQYRDEPVGMDEALRDIHNSDDSDKKISSDSMSFLELTEAHQLECIHEALKGDGLSGALAKGLGKLADVNLMGALLAKAPYLGVNFATRKANKGVPIVDEEVTASYKYSSALSAAKANLTNEFYDWIDSIEQQVTAGIQVRHTTSFDSDTDEFFLGNFVELTSLNGDNRSLFYVNSVDIDLTTSITESKNQNPQTVYGADIAVGYCPLLTHKDRGTNITFHEKVFPPLADIPHILKAEPQQAIVTSVSDPLRNGRIQIRYPWQPAIADMEMSPWISVSVPFSGASASGFLMTPDVGDYVMVNYEGGNIERPYIDGSLFHSERGATNWGDTSIAAGTTYVNYRQPHRAITSNGNGITFTDGNASQFIGNLFPAVLGGLLSKVLIDKGVGATGDKRLGGGLVLSDYFGMYSINMSSQTRSISIDSPWGTVSINAFTGINISAPNGDINITGKNVNIKAGNKVTITSGTNIKKKKDPETGFAKVIGSVLGMGLGGVAKAAIKAYTGVDFTKAIDVSFIRSIYEIIFRPVDGSLTLDSKRNLMLQAGFSKISTPLDTLSKAGSGSSLGLDPVEMAVQTAFKDLKLSTDAKKVIKSDLIKLIVVYQGRVERSLNDYKQTVQALKAAYAGVESYNKSQNNNVHEEGKFAAQKSEDNLFSLIKQGVINADLFGEDNVIPNDFKTVWNKAHASYTDLLNYGAGGNNDANLKSLKEYLSAFNVLDKKNIATGDFGEKIADDAQDATVKHFTNAAFTAPAFTDTQTALNTLLGTGGKIDDDHIKSLLTVEENALNATVGKAKKLLKRAVFIETIQKSSYVTFETAAKNNDEAIALTDVTVAKVTTADGADAFWARVLGRLNVPKLIDPVAGPHQTTGGETFGSAFLSGFGLSDIVSYDDSKDEASGAASIHDLFNIGGVAGPRSTWDVSQGRGAILTSVGNSPTYRMNAEGNDANFKKLDDDDVRGVSIK